MKKLCITAVALSTLTLSGIASAQTTSGMDGAFGSLESFLVKYYVITKKWVIHQNYQKIPHLKKIQETNTAKASVQKTTYKTVTEGGGLWGATSTKTVPTTITKEVPVSEYSAEAAQQETSNNLTNTLTQIPYKMYDLPSSAAKAVKDKITTAEGTSFQDYLNDNSLSSMTIGKNGQASDSLYVSDEESKGDFYEQNKALLEKPSVINNNNFDFSNLITPTRYSKEENYAAQQFVKYSASSTEHVATGIHFSKLFERPKAVVALKNSSVYQSFLFRLRGLLAIRSMNINTLNELIAERTVVPGLSEAAGLKKGTGASPLQVEAYQANHRIESKEWYKKIENEPPATVQRETLIVLAEMEHQNYILHRDNENLLAAVTALSLQSGQQNMQNFLSQEVPNMNGEIDKAISTTYPSSTKAPSTSGVAPRAQTSTTSTETTATNTTGTTNSTNSTNTTNSATNTF